MLLPKTIKKTLLFGAVAIAAGVLLFGGELASYAKSSLFAVQRQAKDAVPISFELQRARDLLDEVLPEMQHNIRQIAREEVELEALARSIAESERRVAQEEAAMARLRDALSSTHAVYSVNGRSYDRDEVTRDLAHRLTMLKEAKLVLEGKRRPLCPAEPAPRGAAGRRAHRRPAPRLPPARPVADPAADVSARRGDESAWWAATRAGCWPSPPPRPATRATPKTPSKTAS